MIPGLGRSPGGRHGNPVVLPGESPWTEEPGGLQSLGSQRVRHNCVAKHIPARQSKMQSSIESDNLEGFLENAQRSTERTPSNLLCILKTFIIFLIAALS